MSYKFICLLLLPLLLAGNIVLAEIIDVGNCDTPGDANSVFVDGDFAYIADNQSGMRIIDISDPQNPAQIGSLDTDGATYDVAVAGDIA